MLKRILRSLLNPDGESHEERMSRYKKSVQKAQNLRELEKAIKEREPGKMVDVTHMTDAELAYAIDFQKMQTEHNKLLMARGLSPGYSRGGMLNLHHDN